MKIPKPVRRGDAWRIEFMLNGKRYNSTHDTPIEAKEWAAREMLRLKDDAKRISAGGLPHHTLAELLKIYRDQVSVLKKGAAVERVRINAFIRNNPDLANQLLANITPQVLTAWRNRRLLEVASSTARRDMNLIASAFTYAVKELFWLIENPFERVGRPKSAKSRHRRVTEDEIDRILDALSYVRGTVPTDVRQYTAWCFLLALGTGMRTSELVNVTWDNVFPTHIHLPDTKNDDFRNVPLTYAMRDHVALMRGIDPVRLVPISRDSLKNVFRRALLRAGVEGMVFKDSRHEAATQMAKKLGVMDLAKITGHRDTKTLLNVYYNPTGEELAEKLNRED